MTTRMTRWLGAAGASAALCLLAVSASAQDRASGLGWLAPEQAVDQQSLPGRELPADEFPDAEAVFEKYLEAIGGRDAVFGITSRRFTGTVMLEIATGDGQSARRSGRVISSAEAPALFVQDVIFPGLRSDRRIFDGEFGWGTDDQGNVTVLEGEELSRLSNSSQFYQIANYDSLFRSYEVVGGFLQDDGTRLIRINVEFDSGREESYVFDADTGLLVAVLSDRSLENGERVGLLRLYSDYKEFDGIKYPTLVTERYANIFLEFKISKIERDIEMPPFEVPEEIEALRSGG